MAQDYRNQNYGRSRDQRSDERSSENRSRYRSDDDERESSYRSNAPMEWDSRRYGRDFNDDDTDGGRGIYEQGEQGYGRSGRGGMRASESRQSESQSRDRSGQDYGRFRRGASDSSSEYSSMGSQLYSSPNAETAENRITGSNWSRTGGSGEWYSGSQRPYGGGEQSGYQSGMQGQGGSQGGYQSQGGFQSGYQGGSQGGFQAGRQSSYQDSGQEPYQGGGYQGTSYRGKGPKDYTRSDERLKEIVCELLTDAPHIDASEISVQAKNGEVTLTGTVRDRNSKYAVEDLIESRAGVKEVNNQLRVKSASESSQSSGKESGREGKSGQSQTNLSGSSATTTSQNKQDTKRDS